MPSLLTKRLPVPVGQVASFRNAGVGSSIWVHSRGKWLEGEIVSLSNKYANCMVYDQPGHRFKRTWAEIALRNKAKRGADKPDGLL